MRRMFVFVAVVLVAGCSSLLGIDEGTHTQVGGLRSKIASNVNDRYGSFHEGLGSVA